MIKTSFVFGVALLLIACARRPQYDIVLRNGRVCDGTGAPCVPGGIAINGDTISKVGDLADARGRIDLDVHGQVIAPGFINMMKIDPTGLSTLKNVVCKCPDGFTDVLGNTFAGELACTNSISLSRSVWPTPTTLTPIFFD
jgi:N-acyl-D-aspartate/D-glutamate deacylase